MATLPLAVTADIKNKSVVTLGVQLFHRDLRNVRLFKTRFDPVFHPTLKESNHLV